MDDQKAKNAGKQLDVATSEIERAPNDEESEILKKLETLDAIFAQSIDHAEEFHKMYVKPLLDARLSLEAALELLIAGVVRPN
jgi:predicted ATP-dependent endonuclease of OLD family